MIGSTPEVSVPIPKSFADVLKNEILRDEFHEYLKSFQSAESMSLYRDVDLFKAETERFWKSDMFGVDEKRCSKIKTRAMLIYKKYIVREEQQDQISISGMNQEAIDAKFDQFERFLSTGQNIEDQTPDTLAILSPTLFQEIQNEVFLNLEANFFLRFFKDLSKRTGCFSNLVHRYALDGYRAVVTNHFGNVKTECERLILRYEGRLKEINVELQMYKEREKVSNDIAMKQFCTTALALQRFHSFETTRSEKLRKLKNIFEDQIRRLKAAFDNLNEQIQNVYDIDMPFLKEFQQIERNKREYKKRKEKFNLLYTKYQRGKITAEEVVEKYKSQPQPDPTRLGEYRKTLERKFTQFTADSTKRKTVLKKKLTESLERLETADRRRIDAQKEITKRVLDAESEFLTTSREDLINLSTEVKAISINSDVSNFSRHLIQNQPDVSDNLIQ